MAWIFAAIERRAGELAGRIEKECEPRRIRPNRCEGHVPKRRRRAALGIPTIREAVVKTAAKLVWSPIFEADLEPLPMATDRAAAASMRSRKCTDCCARGSPMGWTPTYRSISIRSHTTTCSGPVPARIVDRMSCLIKAWLKAPVEETNRTDGGAEWRQAKHPAVRRRAGDHPLLANRYRNRFLRTGETRARGEEYRAQS